jgi:hypothetical protein
MKTYRDRDVCVLTIRGELARRIKALAEKSVLEPRAVAMSILRRGFAALGNEPLMAPEPQRQVEPKSEDGVDDGPGF